MVNTRTGGLCGARNTGVLASHGEFVASCDDDDLWYPAKVRLQVDRLLEDPELLSVGAGIRLLMGERGNVDWPAREPLISHARLLENRVKELHSSTLMMRRSAFDLAGLYDEDLPHGYGEDYDWLLRASLAGKVGAVQEILADIRKDVPSWFRGRSLNTATALEYLLEKHPDFAHQRRGHARILGQIAYQRAAAGERRRGATDRRPGPGPLPGRAARLVGARRGRPGHRAGPAADRRPPAGTRALVSRLPNFLYVGPDKAGSSWLHEVLLKHPDVYLTPAKDLYFFDRYYDRGPDWYAAQFRNAGDQRIVGEVCQDYLFHPDAAARIDETLGPVKVMVSLRDPVERAWSSYLYMRKHGIGPDTFAEALRSRPELLEHGRYASGLDRFLQRLPRDMIHVVALRRPHPRPAALPRRRDRLPRRRPAAAVGEGPGGPAAGGQGPVGARRRHGPQERGLDPRARRRADRGARQALAAGAAVRSTDRSTGPPSGRPPPTSPPCGPRWPPRSRRSSAPSGCRSAKPGAGRSAGDEARAVQAGHAVRPQADHLVERGGGQGARGRTRAVLPSSSTSPAACASALSSSSWKSSRLCTVRTTPAVPARAAKRCW